MLEAVALHLQREAVLKKADADIADVFGRSAFNRYYYATFLRARSMMAALDVSWGHVAHKTYPELLKGKVRGRFKKEAKRAQRVQDLDLILSCKRAESACHELADMFIKSYSIRVVADYEPSERVVFDPAGRFQLRGVDINVAHQWPAKADSLCEFIERTWTKF